MRKIPASLVALTAPLFVAAAGLQYPPAPRGEVVEDYHGTPVSDPYRWLEELDSPATKAWVAAERALTAAALAQMPEREIVRKRLTELWNYPRESLPTTEAGWYFLGKNSGLQNQPVLFVQKGLAGEPRVLIDPNVLSSDGTVALTSTAPSPDGQWLGYGLAAAGSDWNEFRVRSVATGVDREDVIKWAKFTTLSWTEDSAGFFYGRYPEPASGERIFSKLANRRLYYHRLGTPQSADRLIFELPAHPEWNFGGRVSSDGRYLVISVTQNGKLGNALYALDLFDPKKPVFDGAIVKLIEGFEANYAFAGSEGGTFFLLTDDEAPRGKLIALDVAMPALAARRVVIPESPSDIIDGARLSAGRLVVTTMRDVASRVTVFDLAGKRLGEVPLPGVGAVGGVSGQAGSTEIFVSFSSFLYPGTILRHDLATGKTETWRETKVAFDAKQFETKQLFYTSKDGKRIPMFVTHRRGLKLDGTAPGWLYGYGGFNVVLHPAFSVPPIVWMERGGVYAVANLRGGGEYGEEWHRAGTKERKQNVFDDYIAAAEFLVRERYTSAAKLVLDGRSNGGLLVGATLNQRPDLARVGLPAVGVMDMLRYHKFTVGAAWARDYGTSDTAEGFAYLSAYSPVHTVKPAAKYPAILVTTGDHDDRVFPAHSYKYTAAMQATVAGRADTGPVLIRIETNAGHGGSSGTTPVSKTIDEWADRMGFAAHHVGWGAEQRGK